MKKDDCTIILGMHRSGTSVLAGCMHILGGNLGEAVISGNAADRTGFFENQDIVLAHDILLRDLGCRWDMVGNLPDNWLDSDAAKKAAETLTGILERQFLGKGPFTLKDPRLCRLMPLWARVLDPFEIQPSFAFVIRHPMEVALSLQERDACDLLKGHLLWMVYNREALQACFGREHLIVTFDQILADPINTVRRVSALRTMPEMDPRKHAESILQFIQPELKHHHQGGKAERGEGLFASYGWVYDQFRNLQARSHGSLLKAGPDEDGKAVSNLEDLREFPLTIPAASQLERLPNQKHAAHVLNNLLDVIGRYEQADLDRRIQRQRLLLSAVNPAETLFLQIYLPDPKAGTDAYSKERSHRLLLAPEEWQEVLLDIPRPEDLRKHRLRIDPLNTRGMASISAVKLMNMVTEEVCWEAKDRKGFEAFSIEGDGFDISLGDSLDLVCTGNDPRILLPALPLLPDCPLRLEIWIKASRRQTALHKSWSDLVFQKKETVQKLSEAKTALTAAQGDLEKRKQDFAAKEKGFTEQLAAKDAELKKLLEQTSAAQARLEEAEKKHQDLSTALSAAQGDLEKRKQDVAAKEKGFAEQLAAKEKGFTEQLAAKEAELKKLLEQSSAAQARLEEAEKKHQDLTTALLAAQNDLDQCKQDFSDQALAAQTRLQEVQEKLEATLEKERQESAREKNDLQEQLARARIELEMHKEQASQKVKEFQERLHAQEALSMQYHQALAKAEEEQSEIQEKINRNHKGFQEQLATKQSELTRKTGQLAETEKRLLGIEQRLSEVQKDYTGARAELEKAHQEGAKRETKLGEQISCVESELKKSREQSLIKEKEFQKQLSFQEELTRQYFQALTLAEQEQADIQNQSLAFHNENERLTDWIQQLKKQHEALVAAKRWKANKGLGPVERMNEVFAIFERKEKEGLPSILSKSDPRQHEKEKLVHWMDQLTKDLWKILYSARWKFGDGVLRMVEISLFRFKRNLAADRIKIALTEFEQWRKDSYSNLRNPSAEKDDIRQLRQWMGRLNKDYNLLMKSSRWKIGNTVVRPVEVLLFRLKRDMAADRIQRIFQDYRS